MKIGTIIACIIGIIIAVVIGLVAYSYTQIQVSLENVSYQGLDFATPTSSTILKLAADFISGNWLGLALTLVTGVKLGLVFGLSNHGFFPVYIPDVSYGILINGIKVGQGQSHIDSTINPGQTKSFQDNTQDIKFGNLEPAITSIVNSGGMANFQVNGTAYFSFLGMSILVPFQSSRQINVVDEIKNHYLGDSQNSGYSKSTNPTNEQASVAPTSCKALDNGVLPDPNCTPGTADPQVTQDNIDSTICASGYASSVRPPVSYTEPLKFKIMDAYGYTDSASNYELDHLIPLEVGGDPTDIKNLWPESHDTTPSSYDKDGFENYLHDQVCSGAMDLKTAQNEISTNWVKYWEEAGSP